MIIFDRLLFRILYLFLQALHLMNVIVGVGSVGASDQFCDKVEVFVPVTEVVTEVFVIVGEAIGVGSVGESDQFSYQVVVFGPVSVVVTGVEILLF